MMGKTPAPTRPRGSYMRGVDGEAEQEEEVLDNSGIYIDGSDNEDELIDDQEEVFSDL